MEPLINPIEILLQIKEMLDRIEGQITSINETMSSKKANQIFTTKEACKYLHTSTRSLQLYRDRGKNDFIQIGRKVLFRSEDLDKFLARFHIKA